MKKIWSILLLAALFMGLMGRGALAQEAGAEDGAIRVYLKSLGEISSLNVLLSGSYSLGGEAGMQFDRDTRVRLFAMEDALYMKVGGFTMKLGREATFARHPVEGENGIYLDPSPRNGLYCGDLTVKAEEGRLRCIATLDLEDYLMGVVPYEMSDSFPMEALKAQAVAARTYALKRRSVSAGRDYDLVDTTADQVFFGYHGDFVNAIAAVEETRGIVGTYNGEYATCYYTASNGGQTALASDLFGGDPAAFGYLAVADDPYDLENPSSRVQSLSLRADTTGVPALMAAWLKQGASEALSAMGYSDDAGSIFLDSIVSITAHSPKYPAETRMYTKMTVAYTLSACPLLPVYAEPTPQELVRAVINDSPLPKRIAGYEEGEPELVDRVFEYELDVYDQLKDQLGMGLNGADYELASVDTVEAEGGGVEGFILSMRRYGHGVGMSQRGAQWMAGQYGMGFLEILHFYYPGLSLEARRYETAQRPPLTQLAAQDPGEPLPELQEGEQYATVTLSTVWSTLNLRAEPSMDGAILAALPSGMRVILSRLEGDWAYVRTARLAGYVAASYLTADGTD